ncbi:hypothetical protein CLAIMM_13892, partial [Cladophialophora immunda]
MGWADHRKRTRAAAHDRPSETSNLPARIWLKGSLAASISSRHGARGSFTSTSILSLSVGDATACCRSSRRPARGFESRQELIGEERDRVFGSCKLRNAGPGWWRPSTQSPANLSDSLKFYRQWHAPSPLHPSVVPFPLSER